jgi:hypothetical protein
MAYIYDGVLSRETLKNIENASDECPHWIEVTKDFDWLTFHDWSEKNLPKYPLTRHSAGSEPYTVYTHKFTVLNVNFEGIRFLAFPKEADKEKVIAQFPNWIKSTNPFKSSF